MHIDRRWIKTTWYMHSVECNSDIMRNIVPFAELLMNLEAVIQSEASQRKTDTV